MLPRLTRGDVERIVDTSLARLGQERLDLVQFHWWDYAAPMWLETAQWLDELRLAGKIHRVSGTNFDTDRMLHMVRSGVPLTSMQVQYSLLDSRPAKRMVEAAAQNGVWLFCYGTVAGGFLGDRWLGQPEPQDFENRSLIKYKLIIDDLGGWDFFQALLKTLRSIADRHGVDIATIASAAMLPRKQVAAVIVGARNRDHLPSNLAISSVKLTSADLAEIDAVLGQANEIEGDVYTLERDRNGRHGQIMKYNLNKGAA
jgi:aryl-alcohol dehydrogenase-like predicted oxidoreductase